MPLSRRPVLLAAALCGLAAPGLRPGAAPLEAAPARPRLVLALSVDQMRFDYLTRFAPLYTGGLKTLRERGAVFTSARYRHACTETGPGHAVMLSGRSPKNSGIVGNDWYDAASRTNMNVVDDPVHVAVGGRGRGASPRNFIGFTVGDMLKKQSPRARVVGVAGKDRSAILMAGHRADAAYWYGAGGAIVTSSYYTAEPPAWLTAFNEKHVPDRYAGQKWTRLLPDEGVYLEYAGPDHVKGEWDNKDTVFPHAIRGHPPEDLFYDDLRRTPFADELILAAALEAMSAHGLGTDDDTDLLAIGFSATDSIGHTYGADSQELMDQLLRVDRTLQMLFDELDRRVGLSRVLVVLSADHGVLPLVEVLQARGVAARRTGPEALQKPVETALQARFPGLTNLVAAWDGPSVYLDLDVLGRHRLVRAEVETAVIEGLMKSDLVDRVYTHADLLGEPPADDPDFWLFRNAFFQPRSAHLVTRLKPYVYVGSYVGGTSHGTVHDYDRHVPVVFMGPGVKPGTYDGESGPEDIAPTLGALLGLDYPEQDGRTLTAALALAAASASDTASWNRPTKPFRVVGPVHFVGTNELASFLVTTPGGHVLIDGGLPESAPLIEQSIRTLGFDPRDIRVLLTTQAHFDHVGSLAHFKRISGGRVEVMDGDVSLVESGGRTDYLFADSENHRFEHVKVDRALRDGDTVSLGGVTLTARKTPGHTPGSTTWLTRVEDGGSQFDVVFAASTGINPGTRLVDRPSYAGIAEDYARSFAVLESLKPDVFLGGHTGFFRMEEKRARLGRNGPHPFVDPEGFRAHVAARKRVFEEQRDKEKAAASPTR